MTDISFPTVSRGQAAVRAADAIVRTLGGQQVQVRVPINLLALDDSSQLGLAGTPTELVALAPVIVRRDRRHAADTRRHELMFSASILATAREITTTDAARTFFLTALSVLVEGQAMRVVSFEADEFSGAPYLFRVVVEE